MIPTAIDWMVRIIRSMSSLAGNRTLPLIEANGMEIQGRSTSSRLPSYFRRQPPLQVFESQAPARVIVGST